jgi:hypothetical protein
MLVARVQTKSMTAEVNEKRIKVLMGPTFWAAISGSIRPKMEHPLHMAKLGCQLIHSNSRGRTYA